MKKLTLLTTILFFTIISFAQVKSPEEFLGYKIGSRYTPHYKIVDYFQYVSQAATPLVKLQQYGETNEHRPLYLAFISSPENISNLENIRLNNLRLAHLAKDNMAPAENSPAIVWLSYNVHGNEASSSEAAMLTLFALTDPSNTETKTWLKNTVVVIDPCLNPDGRERYINWFTSVVGESYNPENISREHREPWPGGRTNHYNFDLNRDWCWQRQIESQQRVNIYSQWMPQVHVDFHEQGINEPYYFAPAAQPYHEVLTKWQRDFQVTIGKNNAKYFDKNNWLYFTKEIFDLLYPSYGDSYPLYNGSIGMTYEQAGIAAGLGANTNEGDTLTLYDRALHHCTTGLSTVETASLNSSELIKEFHKYFNDAVSGTIGEYKSYIIKNNPKDEERIAALIKLLDRNNIQYGSGNGNGKGYNYQTKKEESFNIAAGDLVINTSQPKAALIKVLFEPETKLVDSATYDITAWALPYVYGLDAYASKQSINISGGKVLPDPVNNDARDAYGYIIRWQGVSSVKTIAQLLKKNIRLRFSQAPFEAGGQSFERGSVIILKKGNEKFGNDLWKIAAGICNSNNIKMNAVSTGMVDKGFDFGSAYVHLLTAPRVAMLTGEETNSNSAGEIWYFFDKEINYKITLINAADAGRIDWSRIDVLILPDGRYKFLNTKENSERFHQWIEGGGRVVALEGAVSQLSKLDWSAIHLKNMSDSSNNSIVKDPYESLQKFDLRERDALSSGTPGSIFKVDIDNTHPLMFGYPKYYYTLKLDNAVYEFIKEGGWNTGVIKQDNQLAGYVGYKLNPKLKDGLLFGVQELGNGSVTYLTDNVMFRDFWENGKLMFCNAVFLVGQ